jgi:hypothetical protein
MLPSDLSFVRAQHNPAFPRVLLCKGKFDQLQFLHLKFGQPTLRLNVFFFFDLV